MIGECEMTGKKNVELFQVKIEGTVMNVCKECIKYGEQVSRPSSFKTRSSSFSRKDESEDQFIVKDFAARIKNGREKKNLKQADMAKQLNEKESLIHNIESGHLKPNFPLAKKLERFLGITLIESVSAVGTTLTPSSQDSGPLTMEAAFLEAMKKAKKK
ncbi:MAG: TIGR00270 family protein [Nanoarchaeota archaeon]|nr:TIGR00270 family protein [Nanoarchaeota archaeon]